MWKKHSYKIDLDKSKFYVLDFHNMRIADKDNSQIEAFTMRGKRLKCKQ